MLVRLCGFYSGIAEKALEKNGPARLIRPHRLIRLCHNRQRMGGKPKRKYTVSEKVLAASRRNLEKANAVPNAIRYRPTPRRQAACRENLRKAHARPRSPEARSERQSKIVNRQSSICRWGQTAREQFNIRWKQAAQTIEAGDACQEKLLRGMAGCATRWLTLLRRRLEREQKELLRLLASTPQNALSSATLGCRLVGVFSQPEEMTKSFRRLELRIKRLGRMLWELRNPPPDVAQTPLSGAEVRDLREALEETSAAALGNPLRPMPSPRMAALLLAPAWKPGSLATELPAEEPWPPDVAPAPFGARNRHSRTKNESEPRTTNEWPADFALFHSLVKNALSAAKIPGASLDDCIEHIARLIWERGEVAEREWKWAQEAIESALDGSCDPPDVAHTPRNTNHEPPITNHERPEADLASDLLAALTGERCQQARVQVFELERELAQTVRDYLDLPCRPRPPSKPAQTWADWEALLGLRR
ncbi:MAG: hypothetical protein ACRD3O_14875 [Terriglobia bacterium]